MVAAAARLTGRAAECRMFDELVSAVRAGESRALVVHGEAGIGKTALLEYLAGHADGLRVMSVAGVQSEMELAFAGLHQLCAPVLDRIEGLPAPQRDALRTVFGIRAGAVPDRFLVGLAVLGLLSQVAEERPLLCLVDDQQWLDRASAQVLAFVARRLGAEAVGMVFATRMPGTELAGLRETVIGGLGEKDARAMLDAALTVSIDERVRDLIVAETRGNPLALLELPRGLTPTELAGGFGLPGAAPLANSIEENFHRRIESLPRQTRGLLLLAAADPAADPSSVWRAAARLGIGHDAVIPAVDAGLVELGTRLLFRHPLVRSAVYRSGTLAQRRAVHAAIAEVIDPALDPDRRAWHRAQAAAGPDEEVAAELAHSADRAQARGGFAAAAAFLQRAAVLTLDPDLQAERALAAAAAAIEAGAFDIAYDLLAMAEARRLDDPRQARADLLRGRLAFVTNRGRDAPPLLLAAAARLEPVDTALSRATYLEAMSAAIFAGRLAAADCGVREVARAARDAPRPARTGPTDLLLDGTAAQVTDGYAAGIPMLREALRGFGDGMSAEQELRLLYMAGTTALRSWDVRAWAVLSARHLRLARGTGALSEVPLALTNHAFLLLFKGKLTEAAALIDETEAAKEALGASIAPYCALGLAALRGDADEAAALLDATRADVMRRGEGGGLTYVEWAEALLNNGLARYADARAAAERATASPLDPGADMLAWAELAEAAVRTGDTVTAARACDQLAMMADASGTDWIIGLHFRARGLLCHGNEADRHFTEAVVHLGRTSLRVDLARVHLLYGEWLRRERRLEEARGQLRKAHTMLESMGVTGFAERARRELRAAGEATRSRVYAGGRPELTAQEMRIARMARDGLSNPEIGTRLFISAHTVQYHLRKVFAKLGISSRSELTRVL